MKIEDAQKMLSVKSAAAFGKWIRAGRFPEAYQTEDGQWFLPAKRVRDLREAGDRAEELNRRPGPAAIEGYEGDPFADLDL